MVELGATYLDAIVQLKETMGMTDEDVKKVLDPIMKSRLEEEAKELRLINV